MLGAIPAKSDSQLRNGEPQLVELIRQEIGARGPISFARFMALALYHPQHGYYAGGRAQIGRQGDFFTNVSVGRVFGKLLAAQFARIWQKLGCPPDFTIVEQGAHDGAFAADALGALTENDCFAHLRYTIIEPFPAWRDRQRATLKSFAGKISWRDSLAELKPFTGIHFSNELFDSLPVHLVAWNGHRWSEKLVACPEGKFVFEKSDALSPELSAVRDRLGQLPFRYETEVNLAAPKLMREIAAKLQRGGVIAVDYGFPRAEFYSPERKTGTLQVRAHHRKLSSAFEQIGRADISAHVNWTSLAEAAESAGAATIGFTDQHHFLTGILSNLIAREELAGFSFAEKRALQTLLHPEMLGRSFQVLALGKNFTEPLTRRWAL